MKLLTEYLERAVNLERLAEGEQDAKFRAELLNQAPAYRKMTAKRAEQYGLPRLRARRQFRIRRASRRPSHPRGDGTGTLLGLTLKGKGRRALRRRPFPCDCRPGVRFCRITLQWCGIMVSGKLSREQ